jgi:ribosomal protein L7/L12
MRSFDQLLEEARHAAAEGADNEALLLRIRELGGTKIDSIKIVKVIRGLSLGEADDAVHYSAVWADRRERDESAMDAFLDRMDDEVNLDELKDEGE